MGVACLEFRGENFRGWRENRESFLPRKFPAIRYYAIDIIHLDYAQGGSMDISAKYSTAHSHAWA